MWAPASSNWYEWKEQQYSTLREPYKSESDCIHVGRHLIEPLSAAHLQVSRQFQGGQVSY